MNTGTAAQVNFDIQESTKQKAALQETSEDKISGTVKWFNNAKGYGFIVAENSDIDLFAHYSSITMDGYKSLKAGQSVLFNTKQVENGIHAINITFNTSSDKESQ